MDDLVARTRAWIEGDPDPETRDELTRLLAVGDHDELGERMAGTLAFGTAGLRGAVEGGSNRMNRAVVIRTTRGLADVLRARHGGPPSAPVVVGFDARLSSRQFTEDTIGVLTAAGIEVRYFPEPTPTPLVAFAAKVLGAAAAIVVTASHNPPRDNGYKVYDANAAQIVPPTDGEIARAIDEVGPATSVPRDEGVLAGLVDLAAPVPNDVFDRYWAEIRACRPEAPTAMVRVVYTPMHGVGAAPFARVLALGGRSEVIAVPQQAEPDGRFPTVAFPNPEEPGALDLAQALATDEGADLILANDPDADRLAAAIPAADGWRILTGNQIGVLMADYLLGAWSGPRRPIVINSIVSTPMLGSIATAHDAHFEQTLTGFKWIANAAMDLEADGTGTFVFGFEEALGYSVGPVVRDKDGLSAGLVFADLVGHAIDEGRTVDDLLADLYRRHGVWVSTQVSIVRPGTTGAAEIAAAMDRLTRELPDELVGTTVVGHRDFREDAEERPRWLAATPLVELDLGGGSRVLIRPSGTEPKLKIYVDLRVRAEDDIAAVEAAARDRADRIGRATADWLGI